MIPEEEQNEEAQGQAPEQTEEAAQAQEETPAQEQAPQTEEESTPAEAPKAEGEQEDKAEKGEDESKAKPDKKKDIFAEILGEEAPDAVKIHKAKGSKNIQKGIVHISSTFNNTVVTVTDEVGNAIGWSSAGKMGFKGSRKSTAYAAQVVSQDACRQAMSHGLREAELRVKGPGAGRESAVRAVQGLGIDINNITDVTPMPHNGCRPKKARRV